VNRLASMFSQSLKLFPRIEFERLVREAQAERHARGFSSWGQFVAMLFCQLGRAHPLREICRGLSTCEGKLSHLRIAAPKRSSLACYVRLGRGKGSTVRLHPSPRALLDKCWNRRPRRGCRSVQLARVAPLASIARVTPSGGMGSIPTGWIPGGDRNGALLVWYLRRRSSESPRWLEARGQHAQAEYVMGDIDRQVETETQRPLPTPMGLPVVTSPGVPIRHCGSLPIAVAPRC